MTSFFWKLWTKTLMRQKVRHTASPSQNLQAGYTTTVDLSQSVIFGGPNTDCIPCSLCEAGLKLPTTL